MSPTLEYREVETMYFTVGPSVSSVWIDAIVDTTTDVTELVESNNVASALVTFAGVEKVLTVRSGKSEELRVTTGRRLGDQVEVVSGVKAGEPIIVQPGNLTGGQPVTIEK